ncbi:sulfite exporter TauE/SafE family protein [Methylacidimicrobium sp. B4]|uniref:sulfite exporter TauE/SafE family protein n=1 Tax=Methylacidimicrobium sp. B4 TaxID=2796139 RepID=UPI001A8D3F10|nr:sulfite exporter TauE/SafE family protein [Methylacidimicrobium sp. B4]QSR83880.1 sulfite exporter TauE/SafE family protein [Methylacidimicrobium sp. B4]
MTKFYFLGFCIAFLIGLTGVGGGTLTVPILLFLGIEPAVAVGVALGFSALIKIPSSLIYFLKRDINQRILLLLSLGGIPGVVAGSFLLAHVSRKGHLGSFILLAIGLTVVLSSLLNLWFTLTEHRLHLHRYLRWLPAFSFFIGLEVGSFSAGGGALGSLLLLTLTKLSPSEVVGTDIAFGMLLSLVGGGIHAHQGLSDSQLIFAMVAGGILGAIGGSYACTIIPKKPARVFLLVWLIFVGSMVAIRAVR